MAKHWPNPFRLRFGLSQSDTRSPLPLSVRMTPLRHFYTVSSTIVNPSAGKRTVAYRRARNAVLKERGRAVKDAGKDSAAVLPPVQHLVQQAFASRCNILQPAAKSIIVLQVVAAYCLTIDRTLNPEAAARPRRVKLVRLWRIRVPPRSPLKIKGFRAIGSPFDLTFVQRFGIRSFKANALRCRSKMPRLP